MMKRLLSVTLFALCCYVYATAEVTLPQLFQSGMVLQREKPVPVWGKADAGQQVSISLTAQNGGKAKTKSKVFTTTADEEGRWRIDLPAMKAGGPYVIEVKGDNEEPRLLTDVLVGDVWLCSGQSNIDVTIERVYPWYVKDIDTYENPKIRLFRVQNDTDTRGPRDDIRPTAVNWKPVNKQNAWLFSAVGYFLGRRMFEKSGVPQGIIVNSWGGTPIEAWIAADSLGKYFPQQVDKTRLYQNDELVRAQQRANMLMSQQWNQLLDQKDPGISQQFNTLEYDDSGWQQVDQYDNRWAYITPQTPHARPQSVIGTIWLRQHVKVDKAHAGQPARLLLGTLFDADQTFVNGRQVGSTGYQYPPRRYDIPEGLLREGDNVVTVRFINKYGTAHFIPEKPYLLAFGADRFSLNPLPADVIPLSTKWLHHAGATMPSCPSGDVSLQNMGTTLYNAVLHPLAPYALSGIVWYQGESNTGQPQYYRQLLTTMIGNWRDRWQQPQLPFVVVQLANHMQPSDQPQNSNWAQLREAQRLVALHTDNVELASAIDLGETVDIHPLRKREVAERIGLCFDRLVYHDKKVKLMPQVVASTVEGNRVTLTFDQPLREGSLNEFELAGPDGRFVNATATAQGNTIIVTADIEQPTRLRHAWKDNPLRLNAYALTGLPVGPFELSF